MTIRNYVATGAIPKYRIVKRGAGPAVALATSSRDNLIGVTTDIDSDAGERCDVIREGFARVTYGGSGGIVAGMPLTADSEGKAVQATSIADRIIGTAEVDGLPGDIGQMLINPCRVADDRPTGVDFVIGVESADTINIAATLRDSDGWGLSGMQYAVHGYVSDHADGRSLGVAPSGGIASGTAGLLLIEEIDNRRFTAITNLSGAFNINMIQAGAATKYIVLILPTGAVRVSPAITFAA